MGTNNARTEKKPEQNRKEEGFKTHLETKVARIIRARTFVRSHKGGSRDS